jgi:cytochrome P450
MFLQPIPTYYSLIAIVCLWLVSIQLRRIKTTYDLQKLGGEAPRVKTWAPFGVDFLYHAVRSSMTNTTLNFWTWMFDHTGCAAKGSYTAEIRIMQNVRVLFTADPENVKAILTTQFADYGKGEPFHKDWKEFLGDSIFTTDRKQWHDSRQLIRPMFVRERVGDLDLFEEHVQKLISLLGPGDGRMIRMDKLLSKFALDAATHFLFGQSTNSLDVDTHEFAAAFDEVQRMQGLLARAGPIQMLLSKRSFRAGLKKMDQFIEPYITQALALSQSELEEKLTKSDTFIHALARFTRDRKVIRDQLVAVLLAGRDTTASSLSWVFLELGRNPDVVAKLREEIKRQVGEGDKKPTYHDIKDMKYLTYIINETLRLYPVVPFNVRHALTDTTLPHGSGVDGHQPVAVQKDTGVGYSTLLMQRRRDLYPPVSKDFPYDPLDWVPDRWATWVPKSWQFIPFNGGPRICIGQQFAMVEMGYTIYRIMQNFDLLVDYGSKPILKAEIVLTPAEGVKIGFSKNEKQ